MALIQTVQEAIDLFIQGQHRFAIGLSAFLFILGCLALHWGIAWVKRRRDQRTGLIRIFVAIWMADIVLLFLAAYILCWAVGALPQGWPAVPLP